MYWHLEKEFYMGGIDQYVKAVLYRSLQFHIGWSPRKNEYLERIMLIGFNS